MSSNQECGTSAIRGGVWLAATALVFLGIGAIWLAHLRDSKKASENAGSATVVGAAKSPLEPSANRAWGRLNATRPEYVYGGKALSQWVEALNSTNWPARQAAQNAFGAMGASAAPAIPQLRDLLYNAPLPNAAAIALTLIGPDALPTLIDALASSNSVVRMEVAGAIGGMHDAGAEAVPVLVGCLRDEDQSVRLNAIASLQTILKCPDLAVPALTACLADPDATVRAGAATTLGSFGAAAESAVPGLLQMAKEDADAFAKGRAADALRAISPKKAAAEEL